MGPHTIAIVDDHSLFAESLQGLINNFKDFKVDYIVNNGQELLDKLAYKKYHPDVILLDIKMPYMDGVQVMRWLKSNLPEMKVLALSMDDDEKIIIQMLKYGAKGYLLKDIHPDELEYALNEVLNKGFYYTDRVSDSLINSLNLEPNDSKSKQQAFVNLNEREISFLELACTEKTYREIADEMCISVKTVDGYRESLFKKFGVSNRIGLVIYALKNNMVTI